MDRLWTPWRLNYVTTSAGVAAPACIFCAACEAFDREPLVVHFTERAFVILNKFPYNNGHLMVVPRRHVARLADLDAEDLMEVMRLCQLSERVLAREYAPHGFNMGLNLGRSAGAGIDGHLHVHLVPRWTGDTNFISVVGETRVLPEELHTTAARLRPAFTELSQR